jgi:hypothetical protein
MASPLSEVSALAPVLVSCPTWLHLFPKTPPSLTNLEPPLFIRILADRSYETLGKEVLQHR